MAQPGYQGLDGFVAVPENFLRNQFSVEQSIYPADLMGPTSPYGNNMVVFYISVQNDSKLVKDGNVNIVNGPTLQREGTRSNLEDSKLSPDNARLVIKGEVAIGGAAAGAAAGEIAQSFAGSVWSGLKGKIASKVGTGFGVGAAIASGLEKRETKTIQQAIGLYIPNNLAAAYSMGWDTQNTLAGTAAVDAMEAFEKSTKGFWGTGKDTASVGASALTSAVLSKTGAASRLSATTGNPKKEQIFQGVDFRNFTFDYKFYPRSASEAEKVKKIVHLFKLHMHPEFSPTDGNYLFLYPSEFDIRYYHRASADSEWVENLNIHRHTSCVLANMNVGYGDTGAFSSFHDGHPTQISMSLQFKEIAILTKENIQNGF